MHQQKSPLMALGLLQISNIPLKFVPTITLPLAPRIWLFYGT
jgi:hypothetical protein